MALWRNRDKRRKKPDTQLILQLLLRASDEGGSDWLWETDTQRRIVDPSERMCEALGCSESEIRDVALLKVLAGARWENGGFDRGLRELAEKLKAREFFRDLLLPVYRNQKELWLELSGQPRFSESGDFLGFIGVASDVTRARASADKINNLARFDQLTGLPNRMLLAESMERAVSDATARTEDAATSAIIVKNYANLKSLLGFKNIERLIGRISERLKLSMSEDIMAGIWSSDEFYIIWRDAKNIDQETSKILENLRKPVIVDDYEVTLDIGFGTAAAGKDGFDAAELMRLALARAYSEVSPSKTDNSYANKILSRPTENTNNSASEKQIRSVTLSGASAAREGVRYLISEMEWRFHNGPPDVLHEDRLLSLEELDKILGRLAIPDREIDEIKEDISSLSVLSKRIFEFCKETGELMVAGIKPVLASTPMALGTLLLIKSICDAPTAAVLAPGGALAIIAGYFSIKTERNSNNAD